MFRVSREIEFCYGHRLLDYQGKCRHLHGHRYALEVTLSGSIIKADGAPVNGMVMDFADVKRIANELVVSRWDHAFLAYRGDSVVIEFLASMPGHKTVVLDVVPTAENLAAEAFRILEPAYHDVYGNNLRLERVRLYETPNCWADAEREC